MSEHTRHLTEDETNALAEGREERVDPEARAHLAACAACTGEVEALRGLLEGAAELRGERQPPRDLWPGIAARIQAEAEGREAPVRPLGQRTLRAVRPWLAAAAVVLVAVSSAVTAWLVGGGMDDTAERVAVEATTERPAAEADGFLADATAPGEDTTLPIEARAVTAQYAPSIDRTLQVLRERGDELSPETRAVVEGNLAVIDTALAEIRGALERDPSSDRLLRALADGYERKLGLLREAALLPAEL